MSIYLTKNLQKYKKAFTIIETLVAISILTIALTGPLAIIAQSLRASYFSRDEITAYYLAQEAIEYVRNRRDVVGLQGGVTSENWLQGVITNSDLDPTDPTALLINRSDAGSETNLLAVNLTRSGNSYKLRPCSNVCPPLKLNTTFKDIGTINALYGDDDIPTDSIFTREIYFNEPPPYTSAETVDPNAILPIERELIMTVRVSWSSPSGNAVVSLREHLTNWQLEKIDEVSDL